MQSKYYSTYICDWVRSWSNILLRNLNPNCNLQADESGEEWRQWLSLVSRPGWITLKLKLLSLALNISLKYKSLLCYNCYYYLSHLPTRSIWQNLIDEQSVTLTSSNCIALCTIVFEIQWYFWLKDKRHKSIATNYVKLVSTLFSSLETANCFKSELHIHIYCTKVNIVFAA